MDLDFHGFTRLFHHRNLLTDAEFDLCRRAYNFLRTTLPDPEFFIWLGADESTVANRLATRDRINIARAEDMAVFSSFLEDWLTSLPRDQVLKLDVSRETIEYERSVKLVLDRIQKLL